MSDSTATPGEIMRRLDDVSSQLKDTVKEVREFRNWAERLYVPRGEWVEGRRADQAVVQDVAKDVIELQKKDDANVGFKRQITVVAIGAALSSFGALAVAIVLLVLSGGKS